MLGTILGHLGEGPLRPQLEALHALLSGAFLYLALEQRYLLVEDHLRRVPVRALVRNHIALIGEGGVDWLLRQRHQEDTLLATEVVCVGDVSEGEPVAYADAVTIPLVQYVCLHLFQYLNHWVVLHIRHILVLSDLEGVSAPETLFEKWILDVFGPRLSLLNEPELAVLEEALRAEERLLRLEHVPVLVNVYR